MPFAVALELREAGFDTIHVRELFRGALLVASGKFGRRHMGRGPVWVWRVKPASVLRPDKKYAYLRTILSSGGILAWRETRQTTVAREVRPSATHQFEPALGRNMAMKPARK